MMIAAKALSKAMPLQVIEREDPAWWWWMRLLLVPLPTLCARHRSLVSYVYYALVYHNGSEYRNVTIGSFLYQTCFKQVAYGSGLRECIIR